MNDCEAVVGGEIPDKFFILITDKSSDRMDNPTRASYGNRSRAYASRKEATDLGNSYIRQGKADSYYIMESIAIIRKLQPLTEVIEL